MIQKYFSSKSSTVFANLVVFLFLSAMVYGLIAFAKQWDSTYNPAFEIDLSLSSLPMYSFFSALRGLIAYLISLSFTLVIGYWAAKSAQAEKVILPFLDIMQSIPVLGFLPGLVLGLVALFPHSNVGLELASIVMIFTGQVWNMTFAFYSSLKSIPTDLKEAASVMGLSSWDRLKLLELPFSAMNLTWNSVMSMAGGWFFLTLCEAFTLGSQNYRLPGLGSYVALAIESGDFDAVVAGITAMFMVIIFFDIVLWRPALYLAHKYRLEDSQSGDLESEKQNNPLLKIILRESVISRWVELYYTKKEKQRNSAKTASDIETVKDDNSVTPIERFTPKVSEPSKMAQKIFSGFLNILFFAALGGACYTLYLLGRELRVLPLSEWLEILRDTGLTLLRVMGAVILSTLWATPFGIWVAQSPARLRRFQPLIQLMASFPAPMLYPMAMALFISLNIYFEVSAMLLMLLGVQWYILFNVLAGALRIPSELKLMMSLLKTSKWHQWRYLYLPSILPALVTGWVTAAGGAWNASIVAEVVKFKGQTFFAHGIGAKISQATEQGDFPKLAASLLVMVFVVVLLNRQFWSRLYHIAQTRFRLDL